MELVVFKASEIADFGNRFLQSLIVHEEARDLAAQKLAEADKREGVIDLELTRAVLHMHLKEQVDLYNIYSDEKKSVSTLYRQILVNMGVLKRTITENDEVVYDFTDPNLQNQYDYNTELKKKDEAEWKRRHSRRNSLNIRLSRVIRAAIAMHDAGAAISDIKHKVDKETGERVAMITKGPKDVLGKSSETVIHSKKAANNEGAKFSPTIAGLAKAADSKHKAQPESKQKTETTDGTNTNVVSEEDFLSTMNAALHAIKKREGTFSAQEKTAAKNVLTSLQEAGIK